MVDKQWLAGFQQTVDDFHRRRAGNGDVVSIKVRIDSGCFHREHSPEAFKIIDARLRNLPENLEAIEHESGPELLLYLAVGTGVLSLAKSVVELVTEIIKARSAGIRKGDHPKEPLVLIVRRVDKRNDYREDVVLRIGHTDTVDSGVIEDQLNASIRELFKDNV
jgi:acetylornithine deacetylase/succinyl-diaminopimelate desuccinylase-like protein